MTQPVEWWSADGERSGYATATVGAEPGVCAPLRAASPPPGAACRVSRSAKLVWKPVAARWRVAAGEQPVRD